MFTQSNVPGTVSVKLSANNFNKDTYVVRVPRNTVNLDNLLSGISESYPGLAPYQIEHSAELLKHEILHQLKSGNAVNVLELGTLYLAPVGTVSATNPSLQEITEFTLKFTLSKEALSSLSALSADSFMISDATPVIGSIESLKDGNTEGTLYKNFGVRLKGSKLKLSDENSGIYFVPLTEDGKAQTDEFTWIAADTGYLASNTAKTVQFNLPDTLQADTPYFIALRTAFVSGKVTRKESLTGFSGITVKVQV